METQPMALDSLAAQPGGLDDFRVTAPREITAMLRQLCDGNVHLNLNASNGSVLGALLWTVDTVRERIGFSADESNPTLQALLACDEVVVVGYLDSVKLQFDLGPLVLVRGSNGRDCVLTAALPRQLFRFQRRSGFRVRPLLNHAPLARLQGGAGGQLALRVLDLSIGGCALFLPDEVAPMQPGVQFNQVRIELDADTHLLVNLRLQHVTSINPASRGVRLGCEFINASGDALRSLQRFIDQTQKRRKLMALP
jgi:c-di-GMP-binding flagellar brake protein YcgR